MNAQSIMKYRVKRPFILDDADPNQRYRTWLESHIGIQGENWLWDIEYDDFDTVVLYFPDKDSAIYFELSFP